MKFTKTLILIFIVFISCNRNKVKNTNGLKVEDSVCLVDVKYFHEDRVFPVPDHIDVILSTNFFISPDSISDVIFKNIPQKDRELFVKNHHFRKSKDSLTLIVQTNYFNFDTIHKKSSEEIEKMLKDKVSLVIKKDTIPLKYCK